MAPCGNRRDQNSRARLIRERQKLGTFEEPSIGDAARKGASIWIPSLHVHLPLFIPALLHKEPGTQTDNIQGLAIQLFIICSYR